VAGAGTAGGPAATWPGNVVARACGSWVKSGSGRGLRPDAAQGGGGGGRGDAEVAYARLEALCQAIKAELGGDLKIHDAAVLPAFITLPQVTAAEYGRVRARGAPGAPRRWAAWHAPLGCGRLTEVSATKACICAGSYAYALSGVQLDPALHQGQTAMCEPPRARRAVRV